VVAVRKHWLPASIVRDIIQRHESRPAGGVHVDGLELEVDHKCFVPTLGKISTQLAQYIVSIPQVGQRVLDLGTGSGYFAIHVAKVAQAWALGVDVKDNLCDQAQANAARNGVADLTEFRTCTLTDMYSCIDEDEKFDLIVANLPFTRWIRAFRSWRAYRSDYYPCFRGTTRLLEQLVLGSQYHVRAHSRLVFCFGESGDREYLSSLIDLSAWKIKAIAPYAGNNDTFFIYDLELKPDVKADYLSLMGASAG
jgi:tRNA1(Val) A37 N6-methylase TrmN6